MLRSHLLLLSERWCQLLGNILQAVVKSMEVYARCAVLACSHVHEEGVEGGYSLVAMA